MAYTIRLTGKKQKVTAIWQLLESAKKQLEAEEGRIGTARKYQ